MSDDNTPQQSLGDQAMSHFGGIADAAEQHAQNAMADIGSTYQAVLWGWNTQWSNQAATHAIAEQTIAAQQFEVEETPEITQDNPGLEYC